MVRIHLSTCKHFLSMPSSINDRLQGIAISVLLAMFWLRQSHRRSRFRSFCYKKYNIPHVPRNLLHSYTKPIKE